MLYGAGLRFSEATRLALADVDLTEATKRVLALGDADRSHLRAFGFDQIAVTASICERRTPPPSFSRRRTKLN